MKKRNRQVCSQEVFDLITAFNALPSLDEQQEVLDVIYDALYDRSYREVIEGRVARELRRQMEAIRQENILLTLDNEDLRMERKKLSTRLEVVNAEAFGSGKKNLRKVKRNLLTIIRTLRIFMGDRWQDALGTHAPLVDAYLSRIDTENLLKNVRGRLCVEDLADNTPEDGGTGARTT